MLSFLRMLSGFRVLGRLTFLLLAVCLISSYFVVPAFARHELPGSSSLQTSFDRNPLLSDFDGDNRVDRAVLVSQGSPKKVIHLEFGNSSWKTIVFESSAQDQGSLISRDIDNDGDMDLVWMSRVAGKSAHWLGDGRGNFSAGVQSPAEDNRIRAILWSHRHIFEDKSDEPPLGDMLPDDGAILPGAGLYLQEPLWVETSLMLGPETALQSYASEILKARSPPSFSR